MGTTLQTGAKSSAPPSIKLLNVGDEVKFAVVDLALDLPMTEFGSDAPKLNAKGNQMTQHALTVLIIDPMQGVTRDGETGYRPVTAGDVHTIYISSYAKWDPDRDKVTAPYKSWGGATDDVPGGLEVGNIGSWKFLDELAPTRAGNNGRKDRKFRLRKPTGDEASIVAKCEALHADNQQRIALGGSNDEAAPAGPFDEGTIADEF